MKATFLKEYQTKCQPDVSLYLETAWTGRKAHAKILEKNVWFFFIRPMQFPNRVTCQAEICLGITL
jgi:hypothetical protein